MVVGHLPRTWGITVLTNGLSHVHVDLFSKIFYLFVM